MLKSIKSVVSLMEEIEQKRYCERCGRETVHTLREDALEIEYQCHECNMENETIKTFF